MQTFASKRFEAVNPILDTEHTNTYAHTKVHFDDLFEQS